MGRPTNYTPELKLTFTLLFVIFSLATLFQFFPNHFPLSTTSCSTTTTTTTTPPPPQQPTDQTLPNGVVKRSFYPVGTAAYSFVFMSAYRGGPNTFAIMGLTSKPIHYYGHPTYTCEYQSRNSTKVQGQNLIGDDLGYARVYVVLVINCTFPHGTTDDPTVNGRLLLHVATNGGYDTAVNSVDTITVLTEPANSWTPSKFLTPPKYDYLHCGGSLFGDLSPQRVREWLAYHILLFGKRSHFVVHDTGGVHKEVMEVLKPWIELGYVSLEDAREEGRFDGFYHNQMILLNDCLHKYKFDAKWMFFFDVDEYVYLGQNRGIDDVMESVKDFTLTIFEQESMSNQICLAQDADQFSKQWSFEKLVYKSGKTNERRDRKYAIQPRNVFATGVHLTDRFEGKSTVFPHNIMKYFHFHGTNAQRREPCRQLVKGSSTIMQGTPFILDTSLRSLAPLVKKFELDTIGSTLQSTTT